MMAHKLLLYLLFHQLTVPLSPNTSLSPFCVPQMGVERHLCPDCTNSTQAADFSNQRNRRPSFNTVFKQGEEGSWIVVCTAQCTVLYYVLYCTLYCTVQCTLLFCTVLFTVLCTILCTLLYSVLYSVLCTLYFVLCTLYCVLYRFWRVVRRRVYSVTQ